MLPSLNEKHAVKQILLIGHAFLMAGLGALVLFSELTPLLFLGIVFTLSLCIAPSAQTKTTA